LELARQGVKLCVLGRDPIKLAETELGVRKYSHATGFQIDLTVEKQLQPLLQHLQKEGGKLDILIHSAGIIHQSLLADARIEDLDMQYATNVRAPYRLTQHLLPFLIAAGGQIVFINSSVGLKTTRPEVGQYSATKHALKAIADSLREEVNQKGIRVLTVYLGRTASEMQEAVYRQEGRTYDPTRLLQPEDVASVVVRALSLPATAEMTDVSIRPMTRT
jgi:NADP-dependent 3-hydroxy acid dehydrogenase YdfG